MTHAVKDDEPIKGFDPRDVRLTADEFLDWESPDGQRYELEAGELIMHSAPNDTHGTMSINFGTEVSICFRKSSPGKNCRATGPVNLKSAIEEDDTVFEPDLVITCEPPEHGKSIKEPQVVIEFVSPKKGEKRDQAKVPFYQAIPSVHTIILAYTLQVRVDIWRRTGAGWSITSEKLFGGDMIKIPQLGVEFPVNDLYLKTPFATE